MEYLNFEELNLLGTYRSYGWSITKLGIKCEEYYLSLNLFITNDWSVPEEITEEDYFFYLQEGKLHDYIRNKLDKMIGKLTEAMDEKISRKLST